MKDFEKSVYAKTLEQKKNWYSPVAAAYDRARPLYPEEIVSRAVELAGLSPGGKILEIGCGPGTATKAFARRGFPMICLEPNRESCQLAKRNCEAYPDVEILNATFEEWEPGTEKFDAVLAASSFHWVSSEIGYPKAAGLLKDDGPLVLLWNTPPQPDYEVYRALHEVYEARAPSLPQPEDEETQVENLRVLGQAVTGSGLFGNLMFEKQVFGATYSVDDYLALLSTLSPYIALGSRERNCLFEGLRRTLEDTRDESIQTSYISALHIVRKLSPRKQKSGQPES